MASLAARGGGPTDGGRGSASLPFASLVFEQRARPRPERDSQLELGRGAGSVVYAATLRGEPVAVKTVPAHALSPAEVAAFWREADTQCRLSSDFVVQCEGAAVDVDESCTLEELALVLARMPGGTLEAWCASAAGRAAPRSVRLRKLLDVALGLRYMHSRDVVHADVKPSNVLLDDAGRARLTGLGFRRGAAVRSSLRGARGTPLYTDPALRAPEGSCVCAASDVYALAVLAWEVLAGALPFAITAERCPECCL